MQEGAEIDEGLSKKRKTQLQPTASKDVDHSVAVASNSGKSGVHTILNDFDVYHDHGDDDYNGDGYQIPGYSDDYHDNDHSDNGNSDNDNSGNGNP